MRHLRSTQQTVQANNSFTLIELFIVIGIIAVLSATVVVTINPAERLREARDATRTTDITTLDNTIRISQTQNTALSLGTASTVYISIPDSSSSCANLGLPSLPSGWSYNCASTSTYRNTDGTGWVPINFQDSSLYGIAQLSALPIDPTNTTSTGLYYTYTPGGSWELTTLIESDKYIPTATADGGILTGVYQKGSHIGLTPATRDKGLVGYWDFEEGSGSTVYDRSGNTNNGVLGNSPTHSVGKVGSYALNFNGTNQYMYVTDNSSLNFGTGGFTVLFWMKSTFHQSTIVQKKSSCWNASAGWGICYASNPTNIFISSGDGTSGGSNNTSISGGIPSWKQMGIMRDADGKVYFINDGGLTYFRTVTGSVSNSSNVLIGYGYNYFNGDLDDIRIYNRTLNTTEISAIYNATK